MGKHGGGCGVDGQRKREKESQADSPLIAEADEGLAPSHNPEIMI